VGPDYSHILDRVGARPARRPLTWIARCPVHRDRTPSLSLWIGREGQLLANCWTCRCGWRALVVATNTKPADWFPPKEEGLRAQRSIVATYDYRDEAGRLLYQKVRYCPKAFRLRRWDGSGWKWDLKGVQRVPYRLPELLARPEEPVCVVEGEKDVDALHKLGMLAVCNDDGAENWTLEHGRQLAGRRVAIIPDNDDSGRQYAVAVAGSLLFWGAASLRLVSLPDLPEKGDVSDWLSRFGPDVSRESKRRELCSVIRQAPEWRQTCRV
jgi:putative DNA primase/helicase